MARVSHKEVDGDRVISGEFLPRSKLTFYWCTVHTAIPL